MDTADFERLVNEELPGLLALYHDLHSHPELSGQEARTAARMAEALAGAGLKVSTGVGGHGLVGVLENGPGPVVALRADMDALPIAEATGLPFASKVPGVMHACGHDLHCACLAGAASLLARRRADWSGTLLTYGQGAEEIISGAKAMLDDGLYTRFPRPGAVFALHLEPSLPAGTMGFTPGKAMAGVTDLDVSVRGIGGHGASPHLAKDPVVLAAQIILALQTAVSRGVDPLSPAVLTVGAVNGGSKQNIIPAEVNLKLTLRYYDEPTRAALIEAVSRTCRGLGLAAGLPEELLPAVETVHTPCPWVENDAELTRATVAALRQTFGEKAVIELPPQTSSEDFAWYGAGDPRVPTFFFWLGGADPARGAEDGPHPASRRLHTPQLRPAAEPAIAAGVKALAGSALAIFGR